MGRRKACDCCHVRKIQCDRAIPQCNWCKHHGLSCTYNRVGKLSAKSKTARNRRAQGPDQAGSPSSVGALPSPSPDATLQGTPSTGQTPNKSPSAQPIAGPTESPRPSFGEMHFAGYQLGEISSYCGIPLFSLHGREWIKMRTGEDVGSDVISLVEGPRRGRIITPSMLRDFELSRANMDLPPREVVEGCVATFRASHFKTVFPVVDPDLFRNTIDTAYGHGNESSSLDPITSRACVFSFLAIVAAIRLEFPTLTSRIDGDACASKAQHLLPFVLQETNLTGLQTFLMLVSLPHWQMDAATKSHVVACRMLFMMGGHHLPVKQSSLETESSHSWKVKIQLRKIFWVLYTFDKDMALRTGQPPCIEDEHCDLTFPEWYTESLRGVENAESVVFDGAPGDLRLCLIKSKTYSILYSAKALQKPDADIVRDIRELDEELERWRISLPASTRPQLFYSRERPLDLGTPTPEKMHLTMLHFEYHYLLATIHRAVGRCRAWQEGENSQVEGLGSSLSLSVEASRATIFHLRLAMNYLFEDAFWVVVLYPMSAVMTLFGNIIIHPLDPRSKQDLELLNLTPELLKQMRNRELLPNEIANMQTVDRFVTELIRLGGQAIAKAEATRDAAYA